jgi:hypothetical protein
MWKTSRRRHTVKSLIARGILEEAILIGAHEVANAIIAYVYNKITKDRQYSIFEVQQRFLVDMIIRLGIICYIQTPTLSFT